MQRKNWALVTEAEIWEVVYESPESRLQALFSDVNSLDLVSAIRHSTSEQAAISRLLAQGYVMTEYKNQVNTCAIHNANFKHFKFVWSAVSTRKSAARDSKDKRLCKICKWFFFFMHAADELASHNKRTGASVK